MLLSMIKVVVLILFRKYMLEEKVFGDSWYETFFVIGIFMMQQMMTAMITTYLMLGVEDINRINYCLN